MLLNINKILIKIENLVIPIPPKKMENPNSTQYNKSNPLRVDHLSVLDLFSLIIDQKCEVMYFQQYTVQQCKVI